MNDIFSDDISSPSFYNYFIIMDDKIFSDITENELYNALNDIYIREMKKNNHEDYYYQNSDDMSFVFDMSDISQRMRAVDIFHDCLSRKISVYSRKDKNSKIISGKRNEKIIDWQFFCSDFLKNSMKIISPVCSTSFICTPDMMREYVGKYATDDFYKDGSDDKINLYMKKWNCLGMCTDADVLEDYDSRFMICMHTSMCFPRKYDIIGNIFREFYKKNMISGIADMQYIKSLVGSYSMIGQEICFL